jgi:hypothetical protein
MPGTCSTQELAGGDAGAEGCGGDVKAEDTALDSARTVSVTVTRFGEAPPVVSAVAGGNGRETRRDLWG